MTIFNLAINVRVVADTQEEALRLTKAQAEKFLNTGCSISAVVPKPTVYVCEYDSQLALSNEHFDSEAWDTNHILLSEVRGHKATPYSTVRNILVNILTAAGVVVKED